MIASQEYIAELRRSLELSGTLKPPKPKEYKKDLVWHKQCVVCGAENPPGMARVCSSACYMESAKATAV